MAQCSVCKGFVTDGAPFCSQCGNKIQPVAYTNPAGMQMPPNNMYMQPMPMQQGMMQKPEKKSKKPLLIVLLSLVGAGLSALIVLFLMSNAYRKPVNDYFRGLKDRDYDSLTSAFLPAIAREIDDERRAVGFSKEDYMNDILGDVEITSYKIKGADSISSLGMFALRQEVNMNFGSRYDIDSGYQVKVRVEYKNAGREDSQNITMTLIKCEEGWRVVNDGVLIQSFVVFDDIFDSAFNGYNSVFSNW
ncbi:MAG: hypothetical protein MJ105_08325 [Lachnospiraceae bacterium]|nr:hypothetical protein [Lachnospiraceae bacterium]